MTPSPPRPAESPWFFPAGDRDLFGVLTEPVEGARPATLLHLTGGGYTVAATRIRPESRLALTLAGEGWRSFRFDYHGVGDSTGAIEEIRLDHPFVDDAVAALGALRALGHERVVMVGSCFGARTALTTAATHGRTEGLVLMSTPPIDARRGETGATRSAYELDTVSYLRRARSSFRPSTLRDRDELRRYARLVGRFLRGRLARFTRRPADLGISRAFLDQLETVLDAGTPVLFVFGELDDELRDFRRAREGRLGRILGRGDCRVDLVPGRLHGRATSPATRHALHEQVLRWLDDRCGARGG